MNWKAVAGTIVDATSVLLWLQFFEGSQQLRVGFGEVLCTSVKHTSQNDEHLLKGSFNY